MNKQRQPDRLARRAAARFEAWLASGAAAQGTWQVWFDGSALGGCGPMAAGAFVLAPNGDRYEIVRPLPGRGCNNEAEYHGLLAALELLAQHAAVHVNAFGDSDLVVRQARGEQADKALRLAHLRERALALIASFESFTATWVPRHKNQRADKLAAEGHATAGPGIVRHIAYQPLA